MRSRQHAIAECAADKNDGKDESEAVVVLKRGVTVRGCLLFVVVVRCVAVVAHSRLTLNRLRMAVYVMPAKMPILNK